jgi:glycine cleavage system H lipoate-binding protein
VEGDPSLIGEGDEGWLVKVKDCMFDMELMSKDKYEEYCKSAGLQ